MSPLMLAFVGAIVVIAFYLGRRSAKVAVHAPVAAPAPNDAGALTLRTAVAPAPVLFAELPSLAEADVDDCPSATSRPMFSYVDQISPERSASRFSLATAGSTAAVGDRHIAIDGHDWSLVAVADGLGGHGGGLASQLVVDALSSAFKRDLGFWSISDEDADGARRLVSAIEDANDAICERARSDAQYREMASTVVAALFLANEGDVCIAYVGDSRAYRVRRGACQLLTADHTLAARGVSGPFGPQLYRALGLKRQVKVDLVVASVEADDVYVACTEAVMKAIGEERLVELLEHEADPERAVNALLAAAGVGQRSLVVTRATRRAGPESSPMLAARQATG